MLAFNRVRLIVLPQTISKATGILVALKTLRLSPQNAVAIGDAENDHELLQACEVGIAVAWGSEALRLRPIMYCPGKPRGRRGLHSRSRQSTSNSEATKSTPPSLAGPCRPRTALTVAVRGRNVLMAGDSKSGKEWIAGLLCEQLILYVTVFASSTPRATTHL